MIKKILLVFGFAFISLHGKSQVLITILFGDKLNSPNLEFGLEGGYNWSTITGFQSNKPLSTLNLGFYFDFRIKKDFYIYTGVLVKSNLGLSSLSTEDLVALNSDLLLDSTGFAVDGNYSQRLNYFLVPILAKYRHKSNVYIEAGPQMGLMYKSWVQFDADVDGKDATIKDYNKDDINRFDIGVMVGAGYKFKTGPGWSVGVKYYYGLRDVYKNIANTKNNVFFIKANIPIGAGKKKDKEESK